MIPLNVTNNNKIEIRPHNKTNNGRQEKDSKWRNTYSDFLESFLFIRLKGPTVLSMIYMLLCLEQQLTMEKISLERKLEKETRDLRGSTNCLRPRERERLLLLSLS